MTHFNVARRSLFPFRERSLPFLTVDAPMVNQAFSYDGYTVFIRLTALGAY